MSLSASRRRARRLRARGSRPRHPRADGGRDLAGGRCGARRGLDRENDPPQRLWAIEGDDPLLDHSRQHVRLRLPAALARAEHLEAVAVDRSLQAVIGRASGECRRSDTLGDRGAGGALEDLQAVAEQDVIRAEAACPSLLGGEGVRVTRRADAPAGRLGCRSFTGPPWSLTCRHYSEAGHARGASLDPP